MEGGGFAIPVFGFAAETHCWIFVTLMVRFTGKFTVRFTVTFPAG